MRLPLTAISRVSNMRWTIDVNVLNLDLLIRCVIVGKHLTTSTLGGKNSPMKKNSTRKKKKTRKKRPCKETPNKLAVRGVHAT